jgi:hypothetical protein
MGVSVEFPDALLLASRDEPDVFSHKVMIYTLGHLYTEGKISSGLGAQVLGCTSLEFLRLLSGSGFDVIDYPDNELDRETATSKEIAERTQASRKSHRP